MAEFSCISWRSSLRGRGPAPAQGPAPWLVVAVGCRCFVEGFCLPYSTGFLVQEKGGIGLMATRHDPVERRVNLPVRCLCPGSVSRPEKTTEIPKKSRPAWATRLYCQESVGHQRLDLVPIALWCAHAGFLPSHHAAPPLGGAHAGRRPLCQGGDAARRSPPAGAPRPQDAAALPRGGPLGGKGDLLQNAILRLLGALEDIEPASLRDFFGLADEQMRRELVDLARGYRTRRVCGPSHAGGPNGSAGEVSAPEPPAQAADPKDLDKWCAFHEAVERLPVEQREVVGLI
jgi:hypothetical protein